LNLPAHRGQRQKTFYNVLWGFSFNFPPPNNPTDIINNFKKNDR